MATSTPAIVGPKSLDFVQIQLGSGEHKTAETCFGLMVDAACVAAAAEHGRGVVLTGDEKDLNRLAAGNASVGRAGI